MSARGRRPVRLARVRAEPHPGVVKLCRDLYERAKKGEIRAIAYAGVLAEGGTCSGYDRDTHGAMPALHLACCRMARRFELPEHDALVDLHGLDR